MSKEPVKQSAYSDYLYQKIEEWFGQGRAGFTLKEMSEFAGLKITPNFRRRINHCVARKTLAVVPVTLVGRGSCNLFYPGVVPPQGN